MKTFRYYRGILCVFGFSLWIFGLGACDEEKKVSHRENRTIAVRAQKVESRDFSGFCDAYFAKKRPELTLPELVSAASKPKNTATIQRGHYVWVNFWASWCKPCVEEIPLLASLETQLRASVPNFKILFVSVDADEQSMKKYQRRFPILQDSFRVKDPSTMSSWLASMSLDETASVPIHLMSDQNKKLQCMRAGAVTKVNLRTARALFIDP